jgi:hypothetical protein
MKKVCVVIISCLAVLHVCESFSLVSSFGPSKLRFSEGSFANKQLCDKWTLRASVSEGDEERVLTNEECDVLNLPYGTTLIGEMSDRLNLLKEKYCCFALSVPVKIMSTYPVARQHETSIGQEKTRNL